MTKQLLKLQGLFDSSFDVEGAIHIAQTNEQADLKQIGSSKQTGLNQSNQQRDNDLVEIGSEFEGTLKALDAAAVLAGKKQQSAAQAQVDAANAKLIAARKAYQDSLDEAKRLRNAPSDQPGDTSSQLPKLDGLADALEQAMDRAVQVRGTFNAAAVQGLASTSDTAERTATATEQTARSAKRIFPARIISADNGAHGWTEVQPASGSSFPNLPGGRSGTTTVDAAYEINGRSAVPVNTIVWMMPVSASDGSTTYLFDLGMGNLGSPANMAYSGEHGENASSVTWDINNQTTSRGVSLTVQTGSRYDHNAASPNLYAYLRNLTFDANGHLVAIGPESRVVIDTPEECP